MGKHMAMAKICPVFLKEKRIRELMAEFNCSYKKALMLYVPPSPRPPNMKNDPPLLTQPIYENESSQQDKQILEPSDVYTYASVTKTPPEETRKSSKSEKRRNRRRALKEQEQNIPEFFTEVSEEESRMDDKLSDENRSKNKEQLSWKLFFKKLKEKTFKKKVVRGKTG
ncbi:unnamed protein product [Parnassius apollo]|uniref:(apollo) hypothetical protein n=1 Tax=Parnassius apollo TaxID=110799 RepID=A0A8S3WLL8_PARAO|nr:unnamed protein product [Parnassius apollo]